MTKLQRNFESGSPSPAPSPFCHTILLASLPPPPPPPPPRSLRTVQCCKMMPIATPICLLHPTLSYNPRAHALSRMRKPHWQTLRLLLAHRCAAAPSSGSCCIGCSVCCKMHAAVANAAAAAAAACQQRRRQRHSAAAAAGTSVGHARDVQRLHAAGCR